MAMADTPRSNPDPSLPDGAAAPAVHGIGEVAALIEQAAHDLRSSLNAIQTWGYVLDRSIDSPAASAQRALDGIRSGMHQQLALIEQMEEAVQLLADGRSPEWVATDLRATAEQVIADRRPAAEARGVMLATLECESPGGQDYFVLGDALRLAPLLHHLLIHCIWRVAAGGAVRVHLTADAGYVKFRISESPPLDRSRGAARLAVLTDFFGRRVPGPGSHPPRQSTALLLTRRMVELQGAQMTAENLGAEGDNSGADHASVCIAVRFPRQPAA